MYISRSNNLLYYGTRIERVKSIHTVTMESGTKGLKVNLKVIKLYTFITMTIIVRIQLLNKSLYKKDDFEVVSSY